MHVLALCTQIKTIATLASSVCPMQASQVTTFLHTITFVSTAMDTAAALSFLLLSSSDGFSLFDFEPAA